MQFQPQFLLPVHLLLPLLCGVLLLRLKSRPVAHKLLWAMAGINLIIAFTMVWFGFSVSEPSFQTLDWRLSLSGTTTSSGLFGQVALLVDFLSIPLLLLLPFILFTSLASQRVGKITSFAATGFLFAGTLLVVIGNDVFTLMSGATLATTSLSILLKQNQQPLSLLLFHVIGWSLVFSGLAWLVACAAIVRSAPHGLPGASTTVVSDLVHLIERSAHQHPAAGFIWKQYELLPTLSILIGIGLLGGVVPLHRPLAQLIASGTLNVRLWAILISKLALLLLVRLLVETNSENWLTASPMLKPIVLLSFVYSSLLLMAKSDRDVRIGRAVVWSQQFSLFGFVMIPNSYQLVLSLSVVVHLAALVILCLHEERVKRGHGQSQSLSIYIAIACLSLVPGTTAMLVTWQVTLQLLTASSFGATFFVLFFASLLIAICGLSFFLETSPESSPSDDEQSTWGNRLIVWGWCFVAIFGSFVIPLLLQVVQVEESVSSVLR